VAILQSKPHARQPSLRYAVDGGGVHTLTAGHSADLAELMLVALRKTWGRVYFAFHGQAPAGRAAAPWRRRLCGGSRITSGGFALAAYCRAGQMAAEKYQPVLEMQC